MSGGGTKRVLCIATVLLVTMAIPSAAATPIELAASGDDEEPGIIDVLMEVVNRTVEYVDGFDPNDDVATMLEKAEKYVKDIVEVLLDVVCTEFDLGLGLPSVDPWRVFDGILTVRVPGYGYDAEADQYGVGIFTIQAGFDLDCSLDPIFKKPQPAEGRLPIEGAGVWDR